MAYGLEKHCVCSIYLALYIALYPHRIDRTGCLMNLILHIPVLQPVNDTVTRKSHNIKMPELYQVESPHHVESSSGKAGHYLVLPSL
jgi:hypothetical protein